MYSRLVKQPNGKYARYSSMFDGIVEYDLTEQDYIEQEINSAIHDALQNALKTINRSISIHGLFQTEIILNNDGIKEHFGIDTEYKENNGFIIKGCDK